MMSAKDKALDLMVYFITEKAQGVPTMSNFQAAHCALLCVDKIEEALTDYGGDSHELQNMDSEFRYWEEVKKEIKKIG